jgi:hemolysin D
MPKCMSCSESYGSPRLAAASAPQRLVEITAAVAQAESQVRQYDSNFRRAHLAELNEAEQKEAVTSQDLIRAEMRHRLQTLESPIGGTVQQLAIHTIGGVVTPAQQLMVMVPDDDALEIEATLQNRDIGFVRAGQEAEIKLETFLFTRYGTVRGRVVSLSSDAIVDSRQAHGLPQGQNQAQLRGQPSQEPVYIARVRLEQATMEIDRRMVSLGPGMRATVEIKTDQRRVLDYLLSPVRRYRHDSFRER